jgi:hypothetical protein
MLVVEKLLIPLVPRIEAGMLLNLLNVAVKHDTREEHGFDMIDRMLEWETFREGCSMMLC